MKRLSKGREKKGIRKLIYVPAVEVWDSVKVQAKNENRSVSNYLLNLHHESLKSLGKTIRPEKHIILDTPKEIRKKLKRNQPVESDWRNEIRGIPKKGKK